MREWEHREWGEPAASASDIICDYCCIVRDSKQLEATNGPSDNLWYMHTVDYYVAF